MVFLADIENVSADLSTAELVDLSTYTTPARNTLGLYLYFYKRDAQNNDTQISINNTSPTTVTAWNFTLPSPDGVFVYIIFGFPLWTAGSYVLNNCVLYNGIYYKANTSTTGTPGVSGQWTVINDILAEVLNLSNSNVTITQGYAWSAARAEAGKIGDHEQALGQKIIQGKCRNWEDAASVLLGGGLIESAFVNFRRAYYTTAQEIIDYVDNQFN